MKVTGEYLVINGLKIPRYREKDRLLPISRRIPRGVVSVTPFERATLLKIKNRIPAKLNATPPAFFTVIGSLSTTAAISIVNIGDVVTMIEQSIGVISGIPMRKVICVRKKPRKDAAKIFGRSFLSTFSLGIKAEVNQNNPPAKTERSRNKPKGEIMPPEVRSLQIIILKPKIAYAAKHTKCPRNLFFLSILTKNESQR